jgi:hypothetical protein
LNNVVFPAPLAGRDVEVDVAHGLDAAEAPADPPEAEDRLGVRRGVADLRHAPT